MLSSPALRSRALAEQFRDVGFPGLAAHEGYLGDLLLLDTDRGTLLGVSFWDDGMAEERSLTHLAETASAVFGAEVVPTMDLKTYGVRYSRFNFGPGARPVMPSLESVVVRSVVFRGDSMLDPGLQEVLAKHMNEYATQAPGCLGVLMMTDETDPGLIWGTFWADEKAAARTTKVTRDAIGAITASSKAEVTSIAQLEALVFDPIHHRVD